jgi:hypothetical protein
MPQPYYHMTGPTKGLNALRYGCVHGMGRGLLWISCTRMLLGAASFDVVSTWRTQSSLLLQDKTAMRNFHHASPHSHSALVQAQALSDLV